MLESDKPPDPVWEYQLSSMASKSDKPPDPVWEYIPMGTFDTAARPRQPTSLAPPCRAAS